MLTDFRASTDVREFQSELMIREQTEITPHVLQYG